MRDIPFKFGMLKRLPIHFQAESSECGLACLSMISSWYGYETNLRKLRQQFSVSIRGLSIQRLIKIASIMGFSTRPLKLDIGNLRNLRVPCILHWDMNHFVVLSKVGSRTVTIHDPAIGVRKITWGELSKHFTGVALEISPNNNFKKQKEKDKLNISQLWENIYGIEKPLIQLVLLSMLLQIVSLSSPYYSQLVIDDVLLNYDKGLLFLLAISFAGITIFTAVTEMLRNLVVIHFNAVMNVQMSKNVFHHLIRLPMEYFEKRHLGDIISRFGSLHNIRQFLTNGVIEAIVDGLMAFSVLILMSIYSLKLTFIVVFSISFYLVLRLALFGSLKNRHNDYLTTTAIENSYFMETMRTIQTIKLLNAEQNREIEWVNKLVNTVNSNVHIGKLNLVFSSFNIIIFGLENVILIYSGAMLVIDGGFSVGMLIAFLAYKTMFTAKTVRFIEQIIKLKMLDLHLERISDIVLTKKEDIYQSIDEQYQDEVQGEIEVRDLSYSYSEDEPRIINSLTFKINKGESVAIVGQSGSGKTTLIKLLLGLKKAESGSVFIDGVKLGPNNIQNYQGQISSVMQDDKLFSGTLENNITFFTDNKDDDWLKECAKMASIHDDIMKLPMRYNTLVGDLGSCLSGGQVQRILLARALYRKPKILFLDEATSHLDIDNEKLVSRRIASLNITRVIIAHRKETICSADRVIRI